MEKPYNTLLNSVNSSYNNVALHISHRTDRKEQTDNKNENVNKVFIENQNENKNQINVIDVTKTESKSKVNLVEKSVDKRQPTQTKTKLEQHLEENEKNVELNVDKRKTKVQINSINKNCINFIPSPENSKLLITTQQHNIRRQQPQDINFNFQDNTTTQKRDTTKHTKVFSKNLDLANIGYKNCKIRQHTKSSSASREQLAVLQFLHHQTTETSTRHKQTYTSCTTYTNLDNKLTSHSEIRNNIIDSECLPNSIIAPINFNSYWSESY